MLSKLEIAELEVDHLQHEIRDKDAIIERQKSEILELRINREFPPNYATVVTELADLKEERQDLLNLLYVATRYPEELENVRKRMGVDKSNTES